MGLFGRKKGDPAPSGPIAGGNSSPPLDSQDESILIELGNHEVWEKPYSMGELKSDLASGWGPTWGRKGEDWNSWGEPFKLQVGPVEAKVDSLAKVGLVEKRGNELHLTRGGLGAYHGYIDKEETKRSEIRAAEQSRFRAKWGDTPFRISEQGDPVNEATGERMFFILAEHPEDYPMSFRVDWPYSGRSTREWEPFINLHKAFQAGNKVYLITNERYWPYGCEGWVKAFAPSEWPEAAKLALHFGSMGFELGVYMFSERPLLLSLEPYSKGPDFPYDTTGGRYLALIASDGTDMAYLDYALVEPIPKEEFDRYIEPFRTEMLKQTNQSTMDRFREACKAKVDEYYRSRGLYLDKDRWPGSGFHKPDQGVASSG